MVSIFNQLVSLMAQYSHVPILLSIRPWSLPLERQEMHVQKRRDL